MPHDAVPAPEIRIDFIRDRKVLTSHPATVKTEGDLIGAVADAYARFRRENPGVSAFDAEVSIRPYRTLPISGGR